MISHLNGGNTCQPPTGHPEPDWSHIVWDGSLPDPAPPVPFVRAIAAGRLMAHLGTNAVIAAAAVQRAWFAERRALRITVPGASDQFVSDVQRVMREARHVPHTS